MATVTRKFRDDFDTWAADRLRRCEFSPADMEEFKELLRRDLMAGPDLLREGLTVLTAAGVETPATINDHGQRYLLWANYFASEVELILLHGP